LINVPRRTATHLLVCASIAVVSAHAAEPAPAPTELSKITVQDAPDIGYAVQNASTATKTDTPILQTPMVVEALPRQILEEMGLASSGLTDSLAYLGVQTPGWGALGDATVFRGFTSWTTLWNGFRIEDISTNVGPVNGGVWMDNVAGLEVLKGPSSILYGRAEPGGAVNVLTRKPQADFSGALYAAGGSWSERWLSADVTGSVDGAKALRYRLILADEDSNSWYRSGPAYQSFGVAPSLEWRLSPRTTISLEGQYRRLRGFSGQPYMPVDPTTNQPLSVDPKDTLLPGSHSTFDQRRTYISVDHQFSADWSMAWKYMRNDASNPFSGFNYVLGFEFPAQAGALTADLMVGFNSSHQRTDATMLDVTGHATTFGIQHTILLGVDYYATRTDQLAGWDFSQTTNYFSPTTPSFPSGTDTWGLSENDGSAYVQDQMQLPHGLHLLLGLRYQKLREHSVSDAPSLGLPLQDIAYEKDVVLPRAAILWQPLPSISTYYSYSENTGASNGLDYSGKPVDPEWSQQHEVGAKGEWLAGRLNATLALFQLTKYNIASADLAHPGFNVGVGKVRSTGYELNVQGALTDRWNILLNDSYARPYVVIGASGASAVQPESITAGQLLPDVSDHTLSAWSSYRLTGDAQAGLSAGGGINHVSAANPYPGSVVPTKTYTVVALFANYTRTIANHRVSVQANVNNLFNQHYLTYQGDFGGVLGGNWGVPRSVRVSIRADF